MSNKITEHQVAKIERFAKALAGGKVTLLFDADDAGDGGAKESLWQLAQRGLDVRLVRSRSVTHLSLSSFLLLLVRMHPVRRHAFVFNAVDEECRR